ncbi:MAG: acyl-CoA dehydrogenase family protein [Actinomycetota bacterium]|uniref:Acyl-CoA dehydrogenase family protein n=1 Tax=Mycobacterium lentiflavum TaxID=141349 RepID=A0ABY3UV32_MYCLN|nr:acyl-CoA dehydrogenase family protein [Mycobacterium lentiflavum]MEE3062680.1 acyl-CoA dehydrogenase family protein [Actinomycetota bacterium]ULP41549.1 acyl-CoA dehydrogenase family protein [Mycobacterium lentiflavum]
MLSAEESAYAQRVRELAQRELLPLVDKCDEGNVNRALLAKMGSRGLLRDLFGGLAEEHPTVAAAMRLCLLRETLAGVSTGAETALALQGLGSYPILQSGRRETVERWIPGVVRGTTVAAFALTEPEAGSDAAALALTAAPDGDGWRLRGEKMWISNAPEADVYTVFARTTPDAGARGVTAFAVAGNADGLSGEHLDLLSPHPIGQLHFDDVRVEPTDVLGEVDAGFKVAMRTLDLFRPSVGAFAVGMAQAALDVTLEHVANRHAYGAPLAAQQSIAHRLADLATQLEAARLLVYTAARAYDAGASRSEITRRAAMAKLFATEAAQIIVDQCVQLHGAYALRRGHLLEHLYRDVRAPRIYEGASEVQRSIISRELFRERATP